MNSQKLRKSRKKKWDNYDTVPQVQRERVEEGNFLTNTNKHPDT